MKGLRVLKASTAGVRSSSDEATISALAKQTDTAKVPNFIGVIAGRRVKQRLRALHRAAPAKRVPNVSASA
jgi:predicted naringenin-chalcone synthase